MELKDGADDRNRTGARYETDSTSTALNYLLLLTSLKIPTGDIISKVLHASPVSANLFRTQTLMRNIVETGNDSGRLKNRSTPAGGPRRRCDWNR